MIDPLVIITDRLFLRPVELGDAAATAALMSPAISANLTSWPTRMSVADAGKKISDSRRKRSQSRWIDWAIFLKDDLNLIGWVGVGRGNEIGARLNIGYWVGDVFQQQRYGTEAVTAIVSRARSVFAETEMEAFTLPTNAASISILARLGFNEKGREMCDSPARGKSEEFIRFSLDLEQLQPLVLM